MEQSTQHNRYISFCGIECDTWANELMSRLINTLETNCHDNLWQEYFTKKFKEQTTMGHNNLFFIGAQMNNLYSFFNDLKDEEALELLWKLEQECC